MKISAKTGFCFRMGNTVLLKRASEGSNIVYSPLSLHVILSMLAAGTKGHTLEQLLMYLESKSIHDLNLLSSQIIDVASPVEGSKNLTGVPILSFINGAWVDQSFSLKPSFKEIIKSVYKAEVKAVDFVNRADQVKDEVHSWAKDATKGLVTGFLPEGFLDSDTAFVLANALYFKGSWERKFDASMTEPRNFHLLNGQIVRVPFMTSKKQGTHLYGYLEDCKILKIPYQSGQDTRQFSMYFFLPHEKHGLLNLVQKFNSDSAFLNVQFYLEEEYLRYFWIPKFKFSFSFEASKIIKEMGLNMNQGELTEIVDSPNSDNLYVSKIFHKAYIEVNEEGTEAAASTVLEAVDICGRCPIPSFVADHPFMFMIVEEASSAVFYTGAVLNPLLDA